MDTMILEVVRKLRSTTWTQFIPFIVCFMFISSDGVAQIQVKAESTFRGVIAMSNYTKGRSVEEIEFELRQFADSSRIKIGKNANIQSGSFIRQSKISSLAVYDSSYSGYVVLDSAFYQSESEHFDSNHDHQDILLRKFHFNIENGRIVCSADHDPTLEVQERWLICYSPSMILLQFQFYFDNSDNPRWTLNEVVEKPLYAHLGPVWVNNCRVVYDSSLSVSGSKKISC